MLAINNSYSSIPKPSEPEEKISSESTKKKATSKETKLAVIGAGVILGILAVAFFPAIQTNIEKKITTLIPNTTQEKVKKIFKIAFTEHGSEHKYLITEGAPSEHKKLTCESLKSYFLQNREQPLQFKGLCYANPLNAYNSVDPEKILQNFCEDLPLDSAAFASKMHEQLNLYLELTDKNEKDLLENMILRYYFYKNMPVQPSFLDKLIFRKRTEEFSGEGTNSYSTLDKLREKILLYLDLLKN